MKILLNVAVLAWLFVPLAQGAATWTTIPTVATNCPTAAKWQDWTDFVPDFDATPDGYLYLKLFYTASVPWDFGAGNAGGYTYVFRVQPNLAVNNYRAQWQQVLRFSANEETGNRVSLCKRSGAFIGPNFAYMSNAGGNYDWSCFAYFSTNAAGVPAIPGVTVNGVANAWRPNNAWPYAAAVVAGFSQYNGYADYYGIYSAWNSGAGNNNMQLRQVAAASFATVASQASDNQFKTTRGCTYKNNTYIWKGPNSANALDGIWVITNVVGNSDPVALAQCVTNAVNLVPVTTMGTGADTWNDASACGIVAFAPGENVLNKDLVVVSMNVNGGQIFAFDLANPTAGPVTLWGVSNICPSGAESAKLQLGKAGRFLFVVSGTTATDRVMYRLDMRGLSAPDPYVDITNTSKSVASSVTAFTVAGTNAGEVVGMWYENALNGSNGPVTVGTAWNVSVPLSQGVNNIRVKGTNTIGIMAVDGIMITRQNPGEGTPVVTITNGNALIYAPDTAYVLAGTANENVFGKLWWTNTTTGTGGTLNATPDWTITLGTLATADNTIVVYGTNLLNASASASTTVALGLDYRDTLASKTNYGLPEGAGLRDINTSLGSDGTRLYFSKCTTAAPLYAFPKDALDSNAWVALAAYPTLSGDSDSGAKGFGYYSNYLYAFGRLSGTARGVMRYDIAGDAWATGTGYGSDGVNTACIVDDAGNVYGGWRGWDKVQKISDWKTFTVAWDQLLGGGAQHGWSTTKDATTMYMLKQWDSGPAQIWSAPADGSASTFTFALSTPWPMIGTGCAIEHVPAGIARSGHNELWVLRGDGSGDLAIYDMDLAVWTKIVLADTFAVGAGMKRVAGNMFFTRGGTDGDSDLSSMSRMLMLPEPACAVLALCGLLRWRQRRR
ncbi:MAG: hypothetical protein NTV22_16860 [bacterium]|nr:hypothetical protein [bacterium]